MDMLFLTDAKLNDFDQSVEIPVVHDWRWNVSGDGTGYLQSPNGDKFCNFNLMSGTLQLTPDAPTETVPGLTLATVQEMGEQYAQNILFDEKIGGAIHMAVGASYPETGGKNKSGLHWDLIKNMKNGGKIYADGTLIYENGKFLI